MSISDIFAALKTDEQLEAAIKSDVTAVFHLQPNIESLDKTVKAVHSAGKKLFIHMDMAEGIGRDKFGVEYVKRAGVDGIISTRSNIIRFARDTGLFTVQRFFAVDSQAVETTAETVKSTKPDMIEIMPGIATKAIEKLSQRLSVRIIAGGLIEAPQEVENAIRAGAVAVSTGKEELWFDGGRK